MAETELKLMDDDEVLNYTQLQRRQFINHFTQNGQTMPTDPKDAKVLLTALADMDRSALGKKRIRTDEQIAQMNAQGSSESVVQPQGASGERLARSIQFFKFPNTSKSLE
jgi:hypothetical protein